jgi:hypothetical protein
MEKMMSLTKIDPATNAVIQEFLDNFVTDPAIRMEIEMFLSHAALANSYMSANRLASLGAFSEVYKDPKHKSARAAIAYAANSAVLEILRVYHETKEQL